MKNGDMPAAPMLNEHGCPQHHSSVLVQEGQITGLTKRELLAAMQRCPDDLAMSWGEAMVGPYPSYDEGRRMRYDEAGMRWWAAVEARYRVMYADALLAELERTP